MIREYIIKISDEIMEEEIVGRPQELVRCKYCKHCPTDPENKRFGQSLVFPDEICPCRIDDDWYSWMPDDNWFCAEGERRDEND